MLQWIYHHTPSPKWRNWLVLWVLGWSIATLFPVAASAQGGVTNPELAKGVSIIEEPLGLPATDIRLIVARIIRVALTLLGVVLLVLVLYGGFLWMTAGGNEEQIGQAKKVITNATIGLAIILSAYAIVAFIFKLLGISGGDGGGPGVAPPRIQNFQGSGALGGIIKDHYPARNQTDVPRNTKIVVTFRKPIKLDTFVADTNNNGTLGDCINLGPNMDWKTDCDSLKNSDNDHLIVRRADNGQAISGATVLAARENGKVFTIVIRPFDPLGSASAPMSYAVRLGKEIHLDDPANKDPSAFLSSKFGNDYYEWQFTVSTALDTTPPSVLNVFPGDKTTEPKNSVIQIDFSEPIDPIGVQGEFVTSSANPLYYAVDGNSLFLQNPKSTRPSGLFRLTNGYRTLEFTPDTDCGVTNACGGKVYCLPVCDKPGEKCDADNYEMLVKAGRTINNSSFEAIPFSGVMDLAGNALDSDPYRQINIATTSLPVFPKWKEPDNFFWQFTISTDIDVTSPYLKTIAPGLDGQFVKPNGAWEMLWSKRMRIDPMYSIGIQEWPSQNIPLCLTPRVWFNLNGTTKTVMDHCAFIDGRRQYYIPAVNSEIEDAHFNCFYPGKGPGDAGGKSGTAWSTQGAQHRGESLTCDDQGNNCCTVTSTPVSKSLCCNGLVDNVNASTTASCVKEIQKDSIF